MSIRQIMVLGVALLAAVAALFLVRGMSVKAPPPAQQVVTNGVPVLVVARPLNQGDAAQPGDLVWANFPTETLSENFIQKQSAPQAMTQYAGAVARFRMEKGEPVTATKLIKPGDASFLAAMLTPGYRAISVQISQNSAAAGFILPNDHVDVISTRRVTVSGGDGREEARSNIILEDVRVLAIDQKYRPPEAGKDPAAMPGAVATLELTPSDAEILAMAGKVGELTLALRGLKDDRGEAAASRRHQQQQLGSVRFHQFGAVAEMKAGGSAQ